MYLNILIYHYIVIYKNRFIAMKKFTILLSIFVFFTIACSTSKKKTTTKPEVVSEVPTEKNTETPAISWAFVGNNTQNLETVLNQAKAEKKLVFIDVYATWCGPCKLMDKEVFTHSPTASFFNENFISYKVNIEKENGPTLKLLYDISGLPTLLFLDAKGNVLEKIENSVTVSKLKAYADSALKKGKR